MHGTMFVHLRRYTEEQLGAAAWDEILTAAGLGPRAYLPIGSYPDEEMVAIVSAASKVARVGAPQLLESFGEYVAPHLLGMYRHLLKPAWRTLEVLLHVEETAHRAVRLQQPGASPPYLVARRIGDQQAELNYTSSRRLCFVAKGIIRGLADHFGERVTIQEPECMHLGAGRCLMLVSTRASERLAV
jgi:predicted hydrocarbon binding protein